VKIIDCTACNIKRLEAIYILLFEDLIIMFGKIVQRLVAILLSLLRKRRSNVSKGKRWSRYAKHGRDGEKERVTLRSSFDAFV
jgi:hypothetical protein